MNILGEKFELLKICRFTFLMYEIKGCQIFVCAGILGGRERETKGFTEFDNLPILTCSTSKCHSECVISDV